MAFASRMPRQWTSPPDCPTTCQDSPTPGGKPRPGDQRHGTGAQCETHVKKVDAWSNAPDEGYAALGITAMAVGNWITKSWPLDAPTSREVLAVAHGG